jgi:hypothetical protein
MPPVERLNRSRGCIVGTVCVGGGCAEVWVGASVGGWVSGEMGMGGELLPRTSGLGYC